MEYNVKISKGPQLREGGIPIFVEFEPNSSDIIKIKNPLIVNDFKFKLVKLLHEPQRIRRLDKIHPETDFAFHVTLDDKITRIAFDEPFHVAEVNGTPIMNYLSCCALKSLCELTEQLLDEEIELTLRRTEFIDGTLITSDILEQSERKGSHSEKPSTSATEQAENNSVVHLPQPNFKAGILQQSGTQKDQVSNVDQIPDQERQYVNPQNHISTSNRNTELQTTNNPELRASNTDTKSTPTRGLVWLRILPRSLAFVVRIFAWLNPCYWLRLFRGY